MEAGYSYHDYLRVHKAFGGVLCTPKVQLQEIDENEPWENLESWNDKSDKRNRVGPFKDSFGNNW